MTIQYNHAISSASPLNFFRVMLRWRASIWKAVIIELLIWSMVYQLVALIYAYALSENSQMIFRRVSIGFGKRVKYIPLELILGFFVNTIVKRWTDAFQNMSRIEDTAILVANIVVGSDERTRLIRRTIVRYLCLTQVFILRDISLRVRRRFPTHESIVAAGFMTEGELAQFRTYSQDYYNGRHWAPLNWAYTLVIDARKNDCIKSDIWCGRLFDEMKKFQKGLQKVCNYDWVQIPLAYPQFVFLAVHSFFIVCLIGRQFEIFDKTHPDNTMVHIIFPALTMLQYMCYLGWMKVAASLMNPFGDDEDDFECNYLIDKNIATAMCIVDAAYQDLPQLEPDIFWDEENVLPIYSAKSVNLKIRPLVGSAVHASGSQKVVQPEMMVVHRVSIATKTSTPAGTPL